MLCLHNFTFVGSQSFISQPSFMFVGAAVSEICKSNRNKEKEKNLQNGYFQFNAFPGTATAITKDCYV